MNSKAYEILNLLEESSFKQSEKLINIGLKSKKNEKLYLSLKCLLHVYVSETNKCKELLEVLDHGNIDEQVFLVLVSIYLNLNNLHKIVELYDNKIKKNDELIKGKDVQAANKAKNELDKNLQAFYEFCMKTCFFKKSCIVGLRLMKNNGDTKYLYFNAFVLYLNNTTQDPSIYNLCLNYLQKSTLNITENNKQSNFNIFLIFFSLYLKLKNYNEARKSLTYGIKKDCFLHPLQHPIYECFLYLVSGKYDACITVLKGIIEHVKENIDYQVFYFDLIIYLMNIKQKDHVENLYEHYCSNYLFLVYLKKVLLNKYLMKHHLFPGNIRDFWNILLQQNEEENWRDSSRITSGNVNDASRYVQSTNGKIPRNHNETSRDDRRNTDYSAPSLSTNVGKEENQKKENEVHQNLSEPTKEEDTAEKQDWITEVLTNIIQSFENNEKKDSFDEIIQKLDELVEHVKDDLTTFYRHPDVKVYLYTLCSFILKGSACYSLIYSIKDDIGLLNKQAIFIVMVVCRMALQLIYPVIIKQLRLLLWAKQVYEENEKMYEEIEDEKKDKDQSFKETKENGNEVKETINEVKADTKEDKENINEVKESMNEVKKNLSEITEDIKENKEMENEVKEDTKEDKENMNEVKETINEVKTETKEDIENMNEVKESVNEVKENLNEVKEGINEMKEDINEMKEDINEVKEGMEEIKENTEKDQIKNKRFTIEQNIKMIQETILVYYKKIYNLEKIYYLCTKEDVLQSFNRLYNLCLLVYKHINIREDNIIVMLVEMATFLDKQQVQANTGNCNVNIFDEEYKKMDHSLKIEEITNNRVSSLKELLIIDEQSVYDVFRSVDNQLEYFKPIKNKAVLIEKPKPEPNKDSKNESTKVELINRNYYFIALSLLKFAYTYRMKQIEIENSQEETVPTINVQYINTILLSLCMNNSIGNFYNFSNYFSKLNIKNIQLISYSLVLFIHTYNYSYYEDIHAIVRMIFYYYGVQQANLKHSIIKCFMNHSIFKVNEILNSYILNASNIYLYFIKLFYLLKKQIEASSRDEFHFHLLSCVRKGSPFWNDYASKFVTVKKEIAKENHSNVEKNKSIENVNVEGNNVEKEPIINHLDCKDNDLCKEKFINNDLMRLIDFLNTEWSSDTYSFKDMYDKLYLDQYHFLMIDTKTMLMKMSIPSFNLSVAQSYSTAFYHTMYIESGQFEKSKDFDFLQKVQILNNIETNNVTRLNEPETLYPMIHLTPFYNIQSSLYLKSHEELLNAKNLKEILLTKTVTQQKQTYQEEKEQNSTVTTIENYRNLNKRSLESKKSLKAFKGLSHEVDCIDNLNTYVSFDKDNFVYNNKFIFNTNINKMEGFDNNSTFSPYEICLEDVFIHPFQTVYVNSVFWNIVMHIFMKAYNFYSFTDVKKENTLKNIVTAFCCLVYLIHYYQLTEPVEEKPKATQDQTEKEADEDTEKREELSQTYNKEEEGEKKEHKLMQAVFHNDLYNQSSILYFKSVLLCMNAYVKILSNQAITQIMKAILSVYNEIYEYSHSTIHVFKEILKEDSTFQVVNLSCLFKHFSLIIQNATILSLIIQSVFKHKKKIPNEVVVIVKETFTIIYKQITELNKIFLSLIEDLKMYQPRVCSIVLRVPQLEVLAEIVTFYMKMISNINKIITNKINIIKSYL